MLKRHLAALLVLAMALCVGCAPQERQETEITETPAEPTEVASASAEPSVVGFSQTVSGVLQSLKSRDGRCLAVYRMDTGACEAALYDLADGELLGLQTLPDSQYEAALLPDGTVALLDGKTGQAFWYDGNLTQSQRQEEGWGSQWLLEDTGYLWALDETGLVRRVNLCNGVRQEYQLPEGEEHALVGFGQDRLLIWSAGEEETTAWLDWRAGELLPDRAWDNAALLWQTGNAAPGQRGRPAGDLGPLVPKAVEPHGAPVRGGGFDGGVSDIRPVYGRRHQTVPVGLPAGGAGGDRLRTDYHPGLGGQEPGHGGGCAEKNGHSGVLRPGWSGLQQWLLQRLCGKNRGKPRHHLPGSGGGGPFH